MTSSPNFSIVRLSDRAVIVQFESVINLVNLKNILSFQVFLNENKFEGFIESVPGYSSVTVYFDPWVVSESKLPGSSAYEKVATFLNSLDVKPSDRIESVRHEIPVCYDMAVGPDLPELEAKLGLSLEEIIGLHSNQEYTVYLIGFTPGFPYLGTLPTQLECMRKENPRKKVAAGSVAIAGKQTGIYPFETPGGWQIIGRTPVKLFSVAKDSPSLLMPGDTVKFEPISLKEFQTLSRDYEP